MLLPRSTLALHHTSCGRVYIFASRIHRHCGIAKSTCNCRYNSEPHMYRSYMLGSCGRIYEERSPYLPQRGSKFFLIFLFCGHKKRISNFWRLAVTVALGEGTCTFSSCSYSFRQNTCIPGVTQ